MTWFTAKAVNTLQELTQTDISAYDEEMKALLPDILGDLMVDSGLNDKTADKMSPLMGQIYSVDAQIAGGSINFKSSPESSLKILADTHWSAVRPLHNDLALTAGEGHEAKFAAL